MIHRFIAAHPRIVLVLMFVVAVAIMAVGTVGRNDVVVQGEAF